ncbi:YihY/virulence factor BrkB family protein [Cellulomonas sp. P4]|uniref:YihY/virulence factor BrkB family protein n=1 Tax=Cellulomonas sp. P4 TaxID=3142533 RepID=UPI0031BB0925
MPATVLVVALLVAVLARRVPWVRHRLPVPASTTAAWLAAAGSALAVADLPAGWRAVAGGALAAASGAAAVGAAAWVTGRLRGPLARRRRRREGQPTLRERTEAFARRHPVRVAGHDVVGTTVRAGLRAGDVRVTGLAAEMTYYALISLVPITTALGASLGYLRPVLGDAQVEQLRSGVVDTLAAVFAQQVAGDVLVPLVDGLLDEQRGGFAVGALLVTLYLASRVFRAAVRALDDAYQVRRRRGVVAQYALGLAFTVGALVTVVTVLLLVVVGPLLGGGASLADRLGLGDAFRTAWDLLRWPAVLAVTTAFLTLLYRYAPSAGSTWRRCLPGAVVGTAGVLLVSAGYLSYVRVAVPDTPGASPDSAAVVQAAAQMLGLVLAGALWLWLCSIAVLAGGVLVAELDAEHGGREEDAERGRRSGRPEDAGGAEPAAEGPAPGARARPARSGTG